MVACRSGPAVSGVTWRPCSASASAMRSWNGASVRGSSLSVRSVRPAVTTGRKAASASASCSHWSRSSVRMCSRCADSRLFRHQRWLSIILPVRGPPSSAARWANTVRTRAAPRRPADVVPFVHRDSSPHRRQRRRAGTMPASQNCSLYCPKQTNTGGASGGGLSRAGEARHDSCDWVRAREDRPTKQHGASLTGWNRRRFVLMVGAGAAGRRPARADARRDRGVDRRHVQVAMDHPAKVRHFGRSVRGDRQPG